METNKPVSKTQQVVAAIILTVLTAFCIEVFLMLYGTISNKESVDFIPWTFHWVWELITLIIVYFIIKRFQVSFGNFYAITFLSILVIAITWSFVPDSLKIMKANYYGVESRFTYDTHEEGRYDEKIAYDFPLSKGFLYEAGDHNIYDELKELSEYNQYVDTRGFLFWQTGLANGFYPYGIKEFNGGDTFLDHIELFFTVGPMVLVECFINGLYSNFLILVFAQVLWFLKTKEHIWWYK